ncbi:MAG: alpha/beta hydrolase [Gemmatimonadales bacterium]|nr:alpha/beta hydrolase [Gemmatimonadales bacterium]
MTRRRWFLGALLKFAIAALAVLATGAAVESVVRQQVRANHPAPGVLADIGGARRLQLDCRGAGSPTVVFESGLDVYGSLAWTGVHDSVARTTRACAYGRAGVMWSDRARGSFDIEIAAIDLHAALVGSGERAPWVLVGHSVGGLYALAFTHLYGAEVRGLVLVDATHPDQFERFARAVGKSLEPSAAEARVGSALARTGALRLLVDAQTPPHWPSEVGELGTAFLPASLPALAGELGALRRSLAHAAAHRSLGDRPLLVLASVKPSSEAELTAMGLTAEEGVIRTHVWRELHEEQARWSHLGRLELVEDASHYIQFDRPEVVIRGVREIVEATRVAGSRR